jgi:hypothetical protein
MSFSMQPGLTRSAAGAVFAVLAWAGAAPSAWASCGDYVVMATEHSTPAEPAFAFPVAAAGSNELTELPPCACRQPASPEHEPMPCPGCSAPAPTETAATPLTIQPTEDSAMSAGPVGPVPDVGADAVGEPAGAQLTPRISIVFRPPR